MNSVKRLGINLDHKRQWKDDVKKEERTGPEISQIALDDGENLILRYKIKCSDSETDVGCTARSDDVLSTPTLRKFRIKY